MASKSTARTSDKGAAIAPVISGAERCVAEVRAMVLSGQLLPGQKVLQSELADQLNLSRIPVREALAKLQAEGVLEHKPNTGFTVARFSSEDLSEIYLMRRLLETELLRSIDLTAVDVDAVEAINKEMAAVSPEKLPDVYQDLNAAFHFRLFGYSPLELVRNEVSRLWSLSGFYRSLYLFETDKSSHLVEEHEHIIESLRARDLRALIAASDAHRSRTENLVVQRLGRSRKR